MQSRVVSDVFFAVQLGLDLDVACFIVPRLETIRGVLWRHTETVPGNAVCVFTPTHADGETHNHLGSLEVNGIDYNYNIFDTDQN